MHHALDDTDLNFYYAVVFSGATVTDHAGQVLYSSALDTATVRGIADSLADVDGSAVYGTAFNQRDVRFSSWIPLSAKNLFPHDFGEMSADAIDDREFVGVPI